jgi:hypothetical protein
MKCFTWQSGKISEGFALTSDERLGQVLFLGETGRGRRFEKVALGRRNPATTVDGRVLEAHVAKITLPAKDGKPETAFFVLDQPNKAEGGVLVRVNTDTGYVRGGQGCWRTHAGSPKTLVSGYGAFGDAGRIGNWDDGIVHLQAGDVLRVYPSRDSVHGSYALWIDAAGTLVTAPWRDYENILAVEKTQEILEQAAESPDALDVVFGQMRTFTFAGGQVTKGLRVNKGATGPVIAFGETGRGRSLVEVPLVGLEATKQIDNYGRETEMVETASVVKLDEKVTPARYSWEQPKVKTIYGLSQSTKQEDAFLVRIDTSGPYTKGSSGEFELWKGSPMVLATGNTAGGAAGGTNSADHGLVVVREGDVLYVRQEGGSKSAGPWAMYVQGGKLAVENWQEWKLRDAKSDPEFYVAKGTAPMGHTPSEWIGKVVTVCYLSREQFGHSSTKTYLSERETGELVRIEQESVVLNLGWDGKDYHEVSVSGSWVKLEKDKSVRKLDGEAAEKRKQIRAQAEELCGKAITATQQSHFDLAEADLRREVQKIAQEKGFDTMPTEGWGDSLTSWVEKAAAVLEKWQTTEIELKTLEERKGSGEVLVDFGGKYCWGGATNQSRHWVIQPDGQERTPDSSPRERSGDGSDHWRLVAPQELAISWIKAYTAADHEFIVNKLPQGGCTKEQLATVERIERKISERFDGATGMSGKPSPGVGDGWGLRKQSKPAPTPIAPVDSPKADLSKADLGSLFGGNARRR